MRSVYCLIVFVVFTLPLEIYAKASAQLPVQFETAPQKVIFFGNSFTYFNNSLHYHLERLVRAHTDKEAFKDYEFRAITISGGKLTEHKDVLQAILPMEPWDAVILQGHSRESIDEEMSFEFRETIQQMVTTTRAEGSTPFLFMTWAYQHKPEMIAAVSEAYTALGRELGIPVAPVGLAFQKALEQYPELQLHTKDRVHPSPAGTYLAAGTFFAVLYGESPVGNPYQMGLEPELATLLQEIALETVEEYQQPLILRQIENQMLL